jgi:hypothetical protein
MIGKPVILAAATAFLSAAAALASDPPAASSPSAEGGGEQRLICRGSSKQLGSRIRRARRCRTAEQWQREDEEKGRVPLSAQVTEGQNDGLGGVRPQ